MLLTPTPSVSERLEESGEGVRLGLKRVRESGKKLGQPTKISEGLIHQIWSLKDKGLGLTQITDEVSVSRSTVYKILKMDRVHV